MIRKCLDYHHIPKRAIDDKIKYDTDIDTSAVDLQKKRRFDIIDRAVQKARQELIEDNMKIRPLHDHIIVTRVEPDAVSKGGIFIPSTAQEKTTEGMVIAVGNGVHLENGEIRPLDVKKGDRVLFEKYAGAEVKISGEEFTVLRESNVICVLGK